MEDLEASKEDPDRKPDFDMKLHAMLPVMRREIPIKAHAHRADDVLQPLGLPRSSIWI